MVMTKTRKCNMCGVTLKKYAHAPGGSCPACYQVGVTGSRADKKRADREHLFAHEQTKDIEAEGSAAFVKLATGRFFADKMLDNI